FCNHSVSCFSWILLLKSIADHENHPQFLRKSLTNSVNSDDAISPKIKAQPKPEKIGSSGKSVG
ncbi:MAG: hypothetical protein SGI77_08225, partial [Pirellulaceae bacterium]|nr:hypothetical protein [Pirellulaceae bacterium]